MLRFFWTKAANSIRSDGFLNASVIYFTGSFLVSVLNYLYQFITARMLPVENFGELQSLLAVFTIVVVLGTALSTIIAKYAADFGAQDRFGAVRSVLSLFTRQIFLISIFIIALFFVFHGYIGDFLNLSSRTSLLIIGTGFLFGLLGSVTMGLLRGLQMFKELSVNNIISGILKSAGAFVFIKWGFSVNGAVGAMVLSVVFGYLLSFYPLKFLFGREKEKLELKQIFRYSLPALFALLFITMLYNLDIILVQHFFPAQMAGAYGALSAVGRINFFLTSPIIAVMFSSAADARGKSGDSAHILKKAAAIVGLIGIMNLVLYFAAPGLVIKILVGSKFLPIAKYLGWFGVSMFLYSIVNLLSSYRLSIGRTDCLFVAGAGVLLQGSLISFFHSDISQIVWIMNGVMLFMILLLIIPFLFKLDFRRTEIARST